MDKKSFICVRFKNWKMVIIIILFKFGKWWNIGGRGNRCKNNFIVLFWLRIKLLLRDISKLGDDNGV